MCGINGIMDLKSRRVDKHNIKTMCDTMKHRGPDGEGIYCNNNIGLGHRRLSIIDLSPAGKQPMESIDKRYVIVFNGEIYNYAELLEELKQRGYKFRGHSDTEVVLNLYIEKGVDCLQELRGMFAFAIWDNKEKKLFIARDRFGEKPLLYGTFNGKFYFASEIKAILEASGCSRKINLEALHLYLLYNFYHVPEPYSIIEGIYKLPAAHYMTIHKSKVSINRYWNIDYKKQKSSLKGMSEKQLLEEYLRLARECVSLREVSDVPVSALLSGGVDSSTVVAFMNNTKLKTFAMGFDKDDLELKRAKRVSKLFKTKHKEILFHKNFLKKNRDIISYLGEPYALLPAVCSYVLADCISKDFKVTLAGNGADEMFYGYNGSNGLIGLTYMDKITPRIMVRLFNKLLPQQWKIKEYLSIISIDRNHQKGELYRYHGKKLKENLYTDEVSNKIKNFDEGKLVDDIIKDCNSPHLIERFYHAGLMLENAHSLTIIADVTGMAHSLEIRSPFLDHKLAEFAAGLPLRMKVRSIFDKNGNKYIMKKSMEEILPNDILYGKKMGFGYNINLGELLRNEWYSYAKSILLNKIPKLKLFKTEYLKTVLEEHHSKKKNHTKLIWSLINFYIWYEIYIKKI